MEKNKKLNIYIWFNDDEIETRNEIYNKKKKKNFFFFFLLRFYYTMF